MEATLTTDSHIAHDSQAFWRAFYARHALNHAASPFAQWCLSEYLSPQHRLLELGCGNGRDSFTFIKSGIRVLATDGCDVAITDNRAQLAAMQDPTKSRFVNQDLGRIAQLTDTCHGWFDGHQRINAIYSRFFLHAVPQPVEDSIIAFCKEHLPSGGIMLHEFRTTRDPLMQKGEALSENERWTDHYRRFIDASNLREQLIAQGWEVLYFVESSGLAVFGSEDPVVARIVARKP